MHNTPPSCPQLLCLRSIGRRGIKRHRRAVPVRTQPKAVLSTGIRSRQLTSCSFLSPLTLPGLGRGALDRLLAKCVCLQGSRSARGRNEDSPVVSFVHVLSFCSSSSDWFRLLLLPSSRRRRRIKANRRRRGRFSDKTEIKTPLKR